MNCIKTIERTAIPHDVFLKTTKLYKEIGKNEYYQGFFTKSLDFYKRKTAEDNARYFYQLFVDDFKTISRSRFDSLALDSATPNNKSEQLYKNILQIFRRIHYQSYDKFNLELAEIRGLIGLLFKDIIETPKYRRITQKKSFFNTDIKSMREVFEKYLTEVNKLIESNQFEPIFLYVNFLIDFINMKVFDFNYNDLVGSLIFYIIMLEHDLKVSHFISFFGKLVFEKEEYIKLLHKSSYQWDEGLAEVMPLTKFFIKIYQQMYDDLASLARDYEYDENLSISKSDYIENTILKMPKTFSKNDIRKKHPLISDSTINRTLKRMQEDNIIRALGKGRKAKWVKIIENEDYKGQMKLNLGEKDG
ncbi:MAG: hypothetical protein K9L64_01020 [Candidatus Izimaplasma sp.]|nr:hypothetical protein [Candidatus Izimaplasma bacterium]